MRFVDFKLLMKEYIVFSNIDIEKQFGAFNKKNLVYWQKRNYIKKLRSNLYCFSDTVVNQGIINFMANKIYKPSYISLETALSHYGFIPEAVFSVTSVSTLKTNVFNNDFGKFIYKSIKKELFFGYQIVELNGIKYKIAEPEKVLLDFFYLNHQVKSQEDIEELRLNKLLIIEKIDFSKLEKYLLLFQSKILKKKIEFLKKIINA